MADKYRIDAKHFSNGVVNTMTASDTAQVVTIMRELPDRFLYDMTVTDLSTGDAIDRSAIEQWRHDHYHVLGSPNYPDYHRPFMTRREAIESARAFPCGYVVHKNEVVYQ